MKNTTTMQKEFIIIGRQQVGTKWVYKTYIVVSNIIHHVIMILKKPHEIAQVSIEKKTSITGNCRP